MANFKQVIFGALAKQGLKQQGATAFVKRERKEKPEAEKVSCDCYTIQHTRVPHPKYGDRVAHFASKRVIDTNCPHRKGVRVAAPELPLQPFEMDEEPQTAEPHPDYSAHHQCAATTKSGARCKNPVKGEGARCTRHPE